jgi:hypothetical protein
MLSTKEEIDEVVLELNAIFGKLCDLVKLAVVHVLVQLLCVLNLGFLRLAPSRYLVNDSQMLDVLLLDEVPLQRLDQLFLRDTVLADLFLLRGYLPSHRFIALLRRKLYFAICFVVNIRNVHFDR